MIFSEYKKNFQKNKASTRENILTRIHVCLQLYEICENLLLRNFPVLQYPIDLCIFLFLNIFCLYATFTLNTNSVMISGIRIRYIMEVLLTIPPWLYRIEKAHATLHTPMHTSIRFRKRMGAIFSTRRLWRNVRCPRGRTLLPQRSMLITFWRQHRLFWIQIDINSQYEHGIR
jgi:hypothetical protein